MQELRARFAKFIEAERAETLASYRAKPILVQEHAQLEQSTMQGGYGRKQLQELVQNAVDASSDGGGRIEVVLTDSALYVANDGAPMTQRGIKSLLQAHISDKRDQQIGRFGIGFKSVLELSERPQIFTEGGGFGFDANRSRAELMSIAPGLDSYPNLRLPILMESAAESATDDILARLLQWAATVVRLPFRPMKAELARKQLTDFPYRFLLFSPHVQQLTLTDTAIPERALSWSAERTGSVNFQAVTLSGQSHRESWLVLSQKHHPSAEAAAEAGSRHAREELRISLAIPAPGATGPRLSKDETGAWNFFPTNMRLPIAALANAAYKMNEDRATVLEGRYNGEIFSRTLSQLIVAAIPHLSIPSDPAKHLDYLPSREKEQSDWMNEWLVRPVMDATATAESFPDLAGNLHVPAGLSVRPLEISSEDISLLEDWTVAAASSGVSGWLHESAFKGRDRPSMTKRLLDHSKTRARSRTDWLEALATPGTIESYTAAIDFCLSHRDEFFRDPAWQAALRDARIVPMADGSVGTLIGPPLYFPHDESQDEPGVVSQEFVEAAGNFERLREFGAKPLEGIVRLQKALHDALAVPSDAARADFVWRTAARFPRDEAISAVVKADPQGLLLAASAAGVPRPWGRLWLSGPMLSTARTDDRKLIIAPDHPFFDFDTAYKMGLSASLPPTKQANISKQHRAWLDTARRAAESAATCGSQFPRVGQSACRNVGSYPSPRRISRSEL